MTVENPSLTLVRGIDTYEPEKQEIQEVGQIEFLLSNALFFRIMGGKSVLLNFEGSPMKFKIKNNSKIKLVDGVWHIKEHSLEGYSAQIITKDFTLVFTPAPQI